MTTSRETPPVGKPLPADSETDRMATIVQDAVREGVAVALSGAVWKDVAEQVNAVYTGNGVGDLQAVIRAAVRRELRKWEDGIQAGDNK